MNYEKIYDQLIKSRQAINRKKGVDIYYEKHHIIPVSFGGTNKKTNLILLTVREHFLAHLLLVEIYSENRFYKQKMLNALMLMCKGANEYIFTSRQYAHIRNEFAKGKSLEERFGIEKANLIKEKLSKHNTGKTWEKTFGKEEADRMKEKLSKICKGRKVSDATKEKIQKTKRERGIKTNMNNKGKTNVEIFGKEKAKEISKKLSESRKGRICIKKGQTLEERVGYDKAEEIKEKQSKKAKGRKFSKETIEKMRQAKVGKTWQEIYGDKRQKNK